ncbi:alpha-D-ribose 1-methylphosphonate 5-triphosphate diphosphatase [Desulfosporosinus fructosivorans]|uniref:Alpha-D-ribose 1-methylphosphonate 5-triphosphate diphosphatase n=1 Tax=Desulfosporosinus fructosivorans TaxID=2018669 RepID=A0A4Z0R9J0_9FIRM|nr:alpha-D-ribose 1-methylphosphonate 5-triphosphate diphosphatase [Desulfosporosinus fructosivorans]TGE38737.1 alpha-D-ribose 1-methylphosphonate 5-triphosphate diphosphatase [Desulfosporosinus fructosivorans]
MRTNKICIYNAQIILPEKVIMGHILIEGNRISEVTESNFPKVKCYSDVTMIDAEGCYVMPGMIDLHSDAIEKEIQPRPNTLFPIDMSFYELEKKLTVSGITTMYHSLTLSDEWGVRNIDMVIEVIRSINRLKRARSMINHKIHLRYELTFLAGISVLEGLIRDKSIDFMSYMDHTPGQGQFKDAEALKTFTIQQHGKKEQEVEDFMDRTFMNQARIDWFKLIGLAKIAKTMGIRLASHDDDNREKIETLIACEGVLSEFPINMETAIYAKSRDIHVCVGAPNIIRGKSHSNNMRAIEAITNNAADIICSDYLPSAMLPAVFHLTKEGIKLTEAVKMVTLNPAKALGVDCEVGSIEVGKCADLIIVEMHQDYPLIRKTLVGGNLVFQTDFQVFNTERVEIIC